MDEICYVIDYWGFSLILEVFEQWRKVSIKKKKTEKHPGWDIYGGIMFWTKEVFKKTI